MKLFQKNYYKFLRNKGYDIGDFTYIGIKTRLCSKDKIKIGKYCCIGNHVLINPAFHPKNWLSVHPFQYRKCLDAKLYGDMPQNPDYIFFEDTPKKIEIENDVWIGENACIMGGVKIHNGAIIGTKAVVTKDIPPYAIAAGIPAKVINYRFEKHIIERLLISQWWNLPHKFIQKLPYNNIEESLNLIESYQCAK